MGLWERLKQFAWQQQGGGVGNSPFFDAGGIWSTIFGRFANSNVDYKREVGDLTQSRLIMSGVNWFGRTLPEAELQVKRTKRNRTQQTEDDHALVKLFRRPNPYFAGALLWKAFALDWVISGNVYWYKVKNALGQVIELWNIPHFAIEPRWNASTGNTFIDYYAYVVDGVEHRLDPADVVHFRNGIDPKNSRLGLSPVGAALREIYTDNEAASFSALLMKNNGVPPFALVPKDGALKISKDDALLVQESFARRTMADNRGKPVVVSNAFTIEKLGFAPDELDLSKLRRLPEETIASLLGIPAIVLQFGAGLERATYSNYSEAREAAYEETVIPLLRYIESELDHQLLSEFDTSGKLMTHFDLSNVRVLQDDQNKLYNRLAVAYRGGMIMRSEARSELGFEVKPEDDVYFVEPKLLAPAPADPNNADIVQ